jgi:nicotinate (nicotinamide) nucleotide adenylyltransferase
VNPATIGHKILLESMAHSGLFDVIDWIPCGERPDKKGVVAPKHRKAMTKLLIKSLDLPKGVKVRVHFDDIGGVNTPSILWMERLQAEHPNDKFFWVTGSDTLMPRQEWDGLTELEAKWTRGIELARRWPFVVLPRVGYPLPNPASSESRAFYDRFAHLIFLTLMLSDISSTEVRELIAGGFPYRHLTIPSVADYIQKHRLYLEVK